MKTAYPEAMTFPAEYGTAPELSLVIDRVIDKFTQEWNPLQMPVGLQFPEDLEAVYEVETRENRVRELQFTVSAAAGFQFVTIITDPVFVPDVGWAGFWLRVVVAVCMASAVLSFRRNSAMARELSVSGAAFSFMLGITVLTWLSHAPRAPYEAFLCTLGFIYANTTVPMCFRYAWPFNLLCLATLSLALLSNPRTDTGLAGALIFMALVGSSYSLIANYRMERGSRLAYLLASKEALRLFMLKRDRDHLEVVSNTDSLTGLANRGHFDRRLAASFEMLDRASKPLCLLLLDVDFFKRYNDSYGHPAGDACLQKVAKLLLDVMRGNKDFAFRYGGEEFAVILNEVTTEDARKIAERIRQAVAASDIRHNNREDDLRILTVSIGVACAFHDSIWDKKTTPQSLLARADNALYVAKRTGRNRVEVADHGALPS